MENSKESKKKKISEKDLGTLNGGCGTKIEKATMYCIKCDWEGEWDLPADEKYSSYFGPCPKCNEEIIYRREKR